MPEVVCLVGWLLVKVLRLVLGLLLLAVGRTGVEISFGVDPGLGVRAAEALLPPPTGTEVLIDVEELGELLPTPGDAEVEAEVEGIEGTVVPNDVAVGSFGG